VSVPVEEVEVRRKEGVRELRRGAAPLRKLGNPLLMAFGMEWPLPFPFCVGAGGGDIDDSGDDELGRRYV
jgi:hypothetical protein